MPSTRKYDAIKTYEYPLQNLGSQQRKIIPMVLKAAQKNHSNVYST